jgi:hypothetical protein
MMEDMNNNTRELRALRVIQKIVGLGSVRA